MHFIVLVLLCAVPTQAWQGRIAGMGSVYGLVEDESDFLTHPAGIANGKGLNFYGFLNTTYDETTKWDARFSQIYSNDSNLFSYRGKGDSWKYDGLLGFAFPLGKARMGMFLEYTGKVGEENKYDGDINYSYGSSSNHYDFVVKDRLDYYALRFLMAVPAGSNKIGGELQIAYRDERHIGTRYSLSSSMQNFPWLSSRNPEESLLLYGIPFDTQYWEASGKLSVEGNMGSGKYAFTLKGGTTFSGNNKYDYDGSSFSEPITLDGTVKGWNIGGDFWLRYPAAKDMSIPMVLSVGYKTFKRDGSGPAWGYNYDYSDEIKNYFIELGGGIDYALAKGTKVATGLYYDYLYLQEKVHFTEAYGGGANMVDYPDFPKCSEHRITLKATGEKEISSDLIIRGGMNLFYGRITKADYSLGLYERHDCINSRYNICNRVKLRC